MRVFAEDPVVVQKFKDAATARRIGASENSMLNTCITHLFHVIVIKQAVRWK